MVNKKLARYAKVIGGVLLVVGNSVMIAHDGIETLNLLLLLMGLAILVETTYQWYNEDDE